MRARSALTCALAILAALPPGAASAGRRVIIADGTAGPAEQATAAAMALLPVVAVVVFALARLIDPPRR
jgi:hypothetical protein